MLPSRLFPGDRELGKKDDDHKPGTKSPLGNIWQHRRAPLRRNWKRLLIIAVSLIGLFYFFKNMPTDLQNPRARPNYGHPSGKGYGSKTSTPSQHGSIPKAGKDEQAEVPQHYFNGPIKFYQLASTLRALSSTRGSDPANRNVLFAAASLTSVSTLLPIACDMALKERNHVHFAMMSRDDISMDILKDLNGVSDCKIIFHDARPDFSVQSTDFRMEASTAAALNHINTYAHPQAVIVDGSGVEENFFLAGIRTQTRALGRTLIELPENTEENLMWFTKLDSSSLSAWSRANIDILVHAPQGSSGSLIRLLDSLQKADYFSSVPPRLTIELPHIVDEPTRRYLEKFSWPPTSILPHGAASQLTLHHRIPQQSLTPEENSIRFLESFWPADPMTSNVLVLSPQTELSPLFFQYLKYTMLEYRYSWSQREISKNLMGISLDLPSTYINDSSGFVAPSIHGLASKSSTSTGATPFLWQTPNSNAALYFGDKWLELHDFVGQILSSQHLQPTPPSLMEKLVSKTYPSWLEYILQLARARGYWTLYPNFESPNSLVTLHNELYQPPEEYLADVEMKAEHIDPNVRSSAKELTADPSHHISLKYREKPLFSTPLLKILPFEGTLPKILDMPLLSWDGEPTLVPEIEKTAKEYSSTFRREIGGCKMVSGEKPRVELRASDLFCLDDEKVAPAPVDMQAFGPVEPLLQSSSTSTPH